MRSRHWGLLFALVLALSVIAAGCGGDDEEGGGATTGAAAAENISGTLSTVAVWTGAEAKAFQQVLDGFKDKYPNVTVKYKGAKDPGQVISTAVQGGNPPDVAALNSPGLMNDFVDQGALKPLEFARGVVAKNYNPDWVKNGVVNGKLYGFFFKGANKSTVWYNTHAFEDAGVEPPKTWEDLLSVGDTLKNSGVPAYSFGASDGWTLTDLFENLYVRQAGPAKYDQLATHKIPWTDHSVKNTLTEMTKVFKDPDNIAGGIQGSLQTNFPDSVTAVFQTQNPKAAMIFEGDFVPGVVAGQTQAKPETDYNVFTFPSVGGKGADYVVGGGDIVVMFKDSPAAKALIRYLASPEAGEIWARQGGFSSPNKNVDVSVYPDEITRTTAGALAEAATFRFDLSDLQPSEFGGDAMFTDLQDFMKNQNVDATAAQLEKDAAAAYK